MTTSMFRGEQSILSQNAKHGSSRQVLVAKRLLCHSARVFLQLVLRKVFAFRESLRAHGVLFGHDHLNCLYSCREIDGLDLRITDYRTNGVHTTYRGIARVESHMQCDVPPDTLRAKTFCRNDGFRMLSISNRHSPRLICQHYSRTLPVVVRENVCDFGITTQCDTLGRMFYVERQTQRICGRWGKLWWYTSLAWRITFRCVVTPDASNVAGSFRSLNYSTYCLTLGEGIA